MKKTILSILLFSLSVSGFAQEAISVISFNPVTLGKGASGYATSSDISWASIENPSAVSFSEKKFDASLLYNMWAPKGVKTSNAGIGLASNLSDKFGISVSFLYSKGESYTYSDINNYQGDTFTPKDMRLALGFSYKPVSNIGLGVNAGYIRSALSPDNSYSVFNGGIYATGNFSGYKVMLAVKNINSGLATESGTKIFLPMSAGVSVAKDFVFSEVHTLTPTLDLDCFFSPAFSAAVGAQYSWKDMVFARAGFHFGTEKSPLPTFASLGLGAKFYGVKLNLAYVTLNEYIGNSLSLGLGYEF